MKSKYDIILIDGMNLSHKMEWVHRHLKDSKGNSTGLLYGFLNFVLNMKVYYGKKVNVLWDSPSLRKKENNQSYKSDRVKKNDDFYSRINNLKEILPIFGIDQSVSFGYEADDIASKVVKEAKKKNKKVLLVTSDSDWRLFSNENVFFLDKNEIKNYSDFYGIGKDFINPKQELFYQAITGNHNNVKGIPRINKKNVLDLIKKSESIDDIFGSGEEKERILIKENKELIFENMDLIKGIDKGYSIKIKKSEMDTEKMIKFCKDHQMNSLIKKIVENGL